MNGEVFVRSLDAIGSVIGKGIERGVKGLCYLSIR